MKSVTIKLVKCLLTIAALFFLHLNVSAQGTPAPTPTAPKAPTAADLKNSPDEFPSNWSIGGQVGAVIYMGDVKMHSFAPSFAPANEVGFGLGLRAIRKLNYIFGLQGDFDYGTLNGAYEPNKQNPTRTEYLHLVGNVFELAVSANINLSNLVPSANAANRKFGVYTTIGLGVGAYNDALKQLFTEAPIATYGTASSRNYNLIIPVALGVNYKLTKRIDLGIEASMHLTNTDLLDQRTFDNSNDKYLFTSFTFGYKLHSAHAVDEWVNPLNDIPSKLDSLKRKVDAMSTDSDKDGVADLFDKDNTTPDFAKTYGDGTAVDSDMDGVPDYKDVEPFSNKGAKVDASGRELDSDGDGVPDSKDLEPNTAQGVMVNFQGKALKMEEPANKSEVGAVVFTSVYFAPGHAQVQTKYHENLANIAKTLKANPALHITITGNTDVVGSDAINDKLGMTRAKVVAAYLAKEFGIDSSRLTTESNGKKAPLALKENAMNRRVDFSVKKK